MTILLSKKEVAHPTMSMIDETIKLIFVKKLNSISNLIKYTRSNKIIIENAVRQADVCVIHLPDGNGDTVVKYAKKYRKPYLCVVCGCAWDSLWNYDWRGKIVAPFYYYQARKSLKDAPFVIYVTTEFLQQRYPTNGRWVACSNVNIETGVNGVLEKRMRRIKNLNEKSVLKIGTSAAVNVAYKGQEFVIKAISILKKRGVIFEYHLIGKGDNNRLRTIAAREGIEELVFFHGALPHENVLSFLDGLDIYIQPSKQEGLPRSVIEAMSRGCLCMGSNIAGLPELIDSDYLFPKGDVLRIVEFLERISKKDLEKQAHVNFDRAKKFDKDYLRDKRQEFLNEFKVFVNQ